MRPLKIFKGDIGPIPRSSPVYSLVRTILQQIAHSSAHGPDSVGKFFLRLNKFCRGECPRGKLSGLMSNTPVYYSCRRHEYLPQVVQLSTGTNRIATHTMGQQVLNKLDRTNDSIKLSISILLRDWLSFTSLTTANIDSDVRSHVTRLRKLNGFVWTLDIQ